jgi:hypothetical protein
MPPHSRLDFEMHRPEYRYQIFRRWYEEVTGLLVPEGMILVVGSKPNNDLFHSIVSRRVSKFNSTAVGLLEIMSNFEEFLLISAGGKNLGFQK